MTIYASIPGPEIRIDSLSYRDASNNTYYWHSYDGNLDPEISDHAAIINAYNAGEPLIFAGGHGERNYAETPALADPSHATNPTYEPLPWMMRLNPLNPRNSLWQTLEYDNWEDVPETGEANTTYTVHDGDESHSFIWDSSSNSYKPSSEDNPSHTTAVFNPDNSDHNLYSESGSSAGSALAHSRVDLAANSALTSIPTADVSFNDTHKYIEIDANMHTAIKVVLAGTAPGGSSDAVWVDGSGNVQTGQPTNYSFTASLVHLRGSTATTLESKIVADPIVQGVDTLWTCEFKRHVLECESGDKVYVQIGTSGSAPSTNPRSKSVTVDNGFFSIDRYGTKVEASIAASKKRSILAVLAESIQIAQQFFIFPEPIAIEDFPNLSISVRFARSGGDFTNNYRYDMNDYSISLANLNEAISATDDSQARITVALRTNDAADERIYRGQGWPGFTDQTALHYEFKFWFWGSDGIIRGAKMQPYFGQVSNTTCDLRVRFNR